MDSKIYDAALGKWITVGTSNAASLELVNPGFVNEVGKSISASNGFTKIDNRLTRAEQNIIWLAHNKGEGGSGGGSGGGTEYTIELLDGDVVYTSTNTATVNIMIKSGGIKKPFTLIAKNLANNKQLGTWKKYSMAKTDIVITDLADTTNIELTAYDALNKYTTPVYFKIISGAIKLEIQKVPPKTLYIGGVNEVPLNYTITNNILNSPAKFSLLVNNIEAYKEENITASIKSIYLDARKILFNNPLFNPVSGQKFIFKAQASTLLNGAELKSDIISFDITVADSNNLIIVTEGISEDNSVPIDTLTKFNKGSQLAFTYYLSCGITSYYTFNIDYTIESVDGQIIKLLDSNTIKNINKSENNVFVYSTVNLAVTKPTEYIRITMKGYAVNDPGDVHAQDTRIVYCTIKESVTSDIYANNDIHTLLAYYSRVTGFPNNSTGIWNYALKTSGQFKYDGAFISKFPNGVDLSLFKVNGTTNGFLTDSDGINKIPAIVLNGESYGRIAVADQMFPNTDVEGVSFFQTSGFCISTTFKAEKAGINGETILSIASFDQDDQLKTGYEISTDKVVCKIGSADTLICKLPEKELLTVDLDVSLLVGTGWYFKIFINGVLSAVTKINETDIDWKFGEDLFIGCRNNKGIRTRFSNVNFYDIKLYTSSQSEYAIVQNYISSTCQAKLKNGLVDANIDSELRIKNLFDKAGKCLIWDELSNNGKGSFLEGDRLYNKLVEQMAVNTPYPLVLVEETSSVSTLFEPFSNAIFSANDKDFVMSKTFPCKITYMDQKGKVVIKTPTGVSDSLGVRIGLQGTSSLSFGSKGYELYMGYKDAANNNLLFQPIDDWLPENQFTLKADVMDSSHVNNVVIGSLANGLVKNGTEKITPFTATPPMALGNDVWGGNIEKANSIRSKFKHTSEGFPCLLFIRFAPDKNGLISQPQFKGIYNFNLGRHAYNNLGLQILTDYTKEQIDGPSVVSDYTIKTDVWTSPLGVNSVEINQNSSSQGAFQQDDLKIIKFMGDVIYTSKDESTAYNSVKTFYTQMANMALSKTQKYTMDDAGQSPTKPIVGEFYDLDKNAYYNFDSCDKHLHWNNACAYFVFLMIFGMVDSGCKNLTLRSWGSPIWYPSLYDMDSAFSLNNAGQDIVAYYAHLHRWINVNSADSNLTTYTMEKNYTSSGDVKQYYASWWNRIWEVLENLEGMDSGSTENRPSIESVYTYLRTNLFPDPIKFIDDYYKSYTDKTGSLIFNYDYKIKYLNLLKKYNLETGQYEDYTDFSQLKFLHGNRAMHVRDWFNKRILFLDGVYGIKKETVLIPISIKSPINTMWASNKLTGSNISNKFGTNMQASSKILYRYSFDKTSGSFWVDEEKQNVIVPIPQGETILYMYANNYITDFDKFKMYPWTGLDNVDLPLFETLDLSGLSNMDAGFFFVGGVYDPNANNGQGRGLKHIKHLLLNNVKLIGDKASAYTLDLTNCKYLQTLDISSSTITKVKLSTSAVLKTFNLSDTNITDLTLSDQSFLETLLINDCNLLTTISISNCESLKTINIPKNVSTLIIKNCKDLSSLTMPYNSMNNTISPLVSIVIDNCPGLKQFTISGQNNPNLIVELVGAWNLETLDVSNTKYSRMTLPALFINKEPHFKSLKSVNISNTEITHFTYNDVDPVFMDLTNFPDLDNINAYLCKNIVTIKCCNNKLNPITLNNFSFAGCASLNRLYGHFELNGTEIFKDCPMFILNDVAIYNKYGVLKFYDDIDATNISFSSSIISLLSEFEGCSMLSYNDFKHIMLNLVPSITSLEKAFKNCSSIAGSLWYDMFRLVPDITSLSEAFNGTSLSGTFFSRKKNYIKTDDSTYGILDFINKIKDVNSAFAGTKIEYIDNRIFEPIKENDISIYSSLVSIDSLFSNCTSLKVCEDTTADVIKPGKLSSKTFFTNLRNLVSIYPKNVFNGCIDIDMVIDEDIDGNTYLFHTVKLSDTPIVLDDSVYSGINLFGEIKVNVFGGINNIIGEYKIPKYNVINAPFRNCGKKVTIDLSKMDNLFDNMRADLRQAISVFRGLSLIGTKTIPVNLLKRCTKLNSVAGLFSNLDLEYATPLEFPIKGQFDDCINLQIIDGLLENTHSCKIKLVGEGFKNCKLTSVKSAFAYSGIYGFIPYRLFFMENISRTINDMSNVFQGCFYLGYDEQTIFDEVSVLYGDQTVRWNDHIVIKRGSPMNYKLDVSKLVKTKNYDYNSADVNSKELDFDEWYIDGYGWENALSVDQADLDAKKLSMKYIFDYDKEQKQCIIEQDNTALFMPTNQNYAIPTDLFRYCSNKCVIGNVLSNLFWVENVLKEDLETGIKTVIQTKVQEGVKGRIPMKLLTQLTDITDANDLFNSTCFDAFVGFTGGSVMKRGIMYPPDLFSKNTLITSLKNTFFNTNIYVGTDINIDIFKNLINLKDITGLFSECLFDNRDYVGLGVGDKNAQIDFVNIFKTNIKISNASNLFSSNNPSLKKGLLIIDSTLLKLSYNINSIESMFSNNVGLKGAVPEFQEASYPYLKVVDNYLFGVQETNITNAKTLEPRLKPTNWTIV